MFKNWLIILVILACLTFSCSSSKAEPVVFSVLYNQREAAPFQEDWLILEEYQKRKHVQLDMRVGDDADYDKAVFQTLDSGNIPDIILKVWPKTIEPYAEKGLLLPFSDYTEQMPYFQTYIQKHDLQEEIDKLRLGNGKYYILPGYQREIQVQQWVYRRDLFEKHQLGAPDNYDELFEALVILKKTYPDTTPLTSPWEGAHLFAMMGAGYDIPAGWNGVRYYDGGEERWQYSPATTNYRELLIYLNRCYEAGILDPEIFTQSNETYMQKIEDGRALFTPSWVSSGFSNWDEKLNENGIPDSEWAPLPVPESTMGIRALPAVDPFRKGLIVPARVVNEPYFERLLAFLDWAVYSEEGMTLTAWGVEGVTYEVIPGGKVFLPEIKTPKNPEGALEFTKDFGLNSIFDLIENEEYEDDKKPPEIVAFLERSLSADETLPVAPDLRLGSAAIDSAQIILDAINPYATQSGQKFITGELDIEENWEDYLSELERRGYLTLEEIWNNAWQGQNPQ